MMTDTKKRMEMFSFYDYSGIGRHLSKMARRGWMLERTGKLTWTYWKIEPANVRFAVTYFPGAANKKDTEDAVVDYLTYCAEPDGSCAAKMRRCWCFTPRGRMPYRLKPTRKFSLTRSIKPC